MTTKHLVALALVAAVVAIGVPAAAAPPPAAAEAVTVACGTTIVENTRLANDLIDCPGNGILIGADNITLDLNGHTIDGDGSVRPGCPGDEACNVGVVNAAHEGGRPGVGPGHRGVTIENGTIRGFGEYGIYGDSVRDNAIRDLVVSDNLLTGIGWCGSADSVIERVVATGSDAGIGLACADHDNRNVTIRDNIVTANGGIQVFVAHGRHVSVERNTISGIGGFAGVLMTFGTSHSRVVENSVQGNEVGIVAEADASEVRGNHVTDNGDGIVVFGDRNVVVGNEIADSTGCGHDPACGVGISIDGGRGNAVLGNSVRRTAGDGIRVAAFDPGVPTVGSLVAWNVVTDAGGDGFSAGTFGDGTTDRTRFDHNSASRSRDDGFDLGSPTTSIGDSWAARNGDLGIEAVAGVTDRGGNVAQDNGNPLQCTNVSCA